MGAKDANVGAEKNRRPNTSRETPREIFLSEIGHTDERPSPELGPETETYWRNLALTRHLCHSTEPVGDYCGWWWCPQRGQGLSDDTWKDLLRALRVLEKQRPPINPHLPETLGILSEYLQAKGWATELPEIDKVVKKMADLPAEAIRTEYLEELRLRRRAAVAFYPPEYEQRGETACLRRALSAGEKQGWTYPAVAALLVLAGASKATLASLTDALRHLRKRPPAMRNSQKRSVAAGRRPAGGSVKRADRRVR